MHWLCNFCCFLLWITTLECVPSPTSFPSVSPTKPTKPPTHGPTRKPTHSPSQAPTITLPSGDNIKIVVDVEFSGAEVAHLCESSQLKTYGNSLLNVFIEATGVADSDVVSAEISSCTQLASDPQTVTLEYTMRSSNTRSKNTVTQSIDSNSFATIYQKNLNLIFESTEVTEVSLVEANAAPKQKNSRKPFAHFFSASFGLGIVVTVVSILWCFLLRINVSPMEEQRVKQLQEEKTKFEAKYGTLDDVEDESGNRTQKQTAQMVEMVNDNETDAAQTNNTDEQPQYNTETEKEKA